LREWAWDRPEGEARIERAGLPIPPKSSYYFCGSIKPDEVLELSIPELRVIALWRHAPSLASVPSRVSGASQCLAVAV